MPMHALPEIKSQEEIDMEQRLKRPCRRPAAAIGTLAAVAAWMVIWIAIARMVT